MRAVIVVMCILLVAFTVFCNDSSALETAALDVEASFMSKYVWRGKVLTDDMVFQPSLTAGVKNFSLNIWGNMDMGDVNNNELEFNELDFTIDYTQGFPMFVISAGVIQYTFPNTDFDSTTEVYLGVSSVVPGNLSATIIKDVSEAEGSYIQLSSAQTFPVGLITGIDVYGAIGYGTENHNLFYYSLDEGVFTDIIISAGLPLGFGDKISLIPRITFTSILNNDIKNIMDSADINSMNMIFGISLSTYF